MELADVPRILSLLNDKNGKPLDEQQIKDIGDYAKQNNMFFGEAAVAMDIIDQNELQTKLLKQTTLKAQAAVLDIEKIAKDGKQEAPNWLKANWGNNGVNQPKEKPSMVDGASAAANIGQNITMIANEHPELAEKLEPSVKAASTLAENIAGNVQPPLDREQANALYKEMKSGLRQAVEESGVELKDKNGQDIKLDDFIEARRVEIAAGINMREAVSRAQNGEGQGANPTVPRQPQTTQGAGARR